MPRKDTMTKKTLIERVLAYEIMGFGAIIVFLWANEIFDLPHVLFRVPATPINWAESLFESVLVVLAALPILAFTRHFLRRIRYLEGFLLFCAGCKRVRVEGKWIAVDLFIRNQSAAEVSHGLCPDCLQQYVGGWGEPAHREFTTENGKPAAGAMQYAACACGSGGTVLVPHPSLLRFSAN